MAKNRPAANREPGPAAGASTTVPAEERMGVKDAADQAGAGEGVQVSGATADGGAALPPVAQDPLPARPKPANQADVELAQKHGLDLADLDDDDLAELRAAAARDAGRGPVTQRPGRRLVLEQNGTTSDHAISLMLEACDIYGVNPSADQVPRELLAWRFYQGEDDPARGVTADAVVIVTGGGLKLKHYDDDDPANPRDLDTVDRLRRAFGLFQKDPKTKETVVLPLPGDLTLPAATVNGIGHTDHQYPGGYVKTGGKHAAAEKERRRAERARGWASRFVAAGVRTRGTSETPAVSVV
jgi:hypothetical protein